MGRIRQALGLEAGRTKVHYVVSRGHYEAIYGNESRARNKARKMLKKHPASEVILTRNTRIENEKRPFWRFWHVENVTVHIERLPIEIPISASRDRIVKHVGALLGNFPEFR